MTAAFSEGNYEEISRQAFERYLLDLLRLSAAEEERLYREVRGESPRLEVRNIIQQGQYPEGTSYKFLYYDNRTGAEGSEIMILYENPQFYDQDGKQLVDADYMAGEMLTWLRER